VDVVGSLAELGGTRSTGIVRHIDELGRIVIPIEIRKRLGIGEKDPVEISLHGDTILLEKPHSVCIFCGSEHELGEHRGRAVCRSCIHELGGPEPTG
jgi:AbrB family transcriptional regulator, transcriptional pleiotropic regulator of transition state genes